MMAVILLWPERGLALVQPEGPAEEGTSHVMFVVVEFVAFPMLLVAGFGAVVSLFFRFRWTRGDERQQIKWFVFASVLSLVFVFAWNFLLDAEGALLQASLALISLILAPAIPIATGIAILRYRLYDIDRIINRTLVYGTLTALLALVYLGGVTTTQAIFRTLTGKEEQPQLAVVVSTLAIAALFNPLRRRIQAFIDRRFYRSKYDVAKTLQAFSAKLRDETDLEALNNELVGVVRETMQPAHVSLWLRLDMASEDKQAD
jgi:heme/copper-type cytochrome/quinol oxidase subunit 2